MRVCVCNLCSLFVCIKWTFMENIEVKQSEMCMCVRCGMDAVVTSFHHCQKESYIQIWELLLDIVFYVTHIKLLLCCFQERKDVDTNTLIPPQTWDIAFETSVFLFHYSSPVPVCRRLEVKSICLSNAISPEMILRQYHNVLTYRHFFFLVQ